MFPGTPTQPRGANGRSADADRRAGRGRWFAFVLALLTAQVAWGQDDATITLGCAEEFPPYIFKDAQGEPQGIYVDLFALIQRQTGTRFRWVLKPWPKAVESLRSGEVDALVAFTPTPERQEHFEFSVPLETVHTYIYYSKDLEGIEGIDDLAGFPVGVVGPSSTEQLLRREAPEARLLLYENGQDMIRAAGAGKIQIFCDEEASAIYRFIKLDLLGRFVRADTPLYSMVNCVGVRRGSTALLARLNAGLRSVSADERRRIERRYFSAAPAAPGFAYWPRVMTGVGILAAVGAVLLLWNVLLRRKVAQATRTLREREEHYRSIVEDQTELICRWKPDGATTFVNQAYCRYFGTTSEALIGREFMAVIPDEDHERVEQFLASLGPDNPVGTHEHRAIAPDGEVRWQQWTDRAILDADGNVIEFQGTGRDITDRRNLLEQTRQDAEIKENLLSELNHRVKNNLATLTSLMYLEQTTPTQTKDQFIEACLNRMTSLAELHSLLSEQMSSSVQVDALIGRVTMATVAGIAKDAPQMDMSLEAKDFRLEPEMAGGLAMALSELVSNALRHGLSKADTPRLGISLRRADGLWELCVSDNGPGLPDHFDPACDGGTGMKLIRHIAEKQLRGQICFRRLRDTTVATVRFPSPPSTP